MKQSTNIKRIILQRIVLTMKKNKLLPLTLSLILALNPAFGSTDKSKTTENHCITEMKNGERFWTDTMLGLDDCQLQDDDMLAVADFLKNKPNIDFVSLFNNQLTSKGAETLVGIQTIRALILDNNSVDDEGAKKLAETKNIKSLSLSYNKITDTGVEYLAKNESITDLILDGLHITPTGAKALGDNKTITYLQLNNDKFFGDFGAIALGNNTTLQTLYLDNDHITDFGARAFINSPVNTLDLSGNSFTDKATDALATVRSTTLGLSNMSFTDQGIANIAANQSIQSLFLNSDQLSDKSALYLSQTPNKISSLWLSYNKLTNQGAFDLSHDHVLTLLDVSFNHIGPAGIAALDAVPGLFVDTTGNDGTNVHAKSKHESYEFELQQKFNKNRTYQILKNIHSISMSR